MNNKTLIIAEAGVNHNGDLEMAKQLIDVAAAAGADIVKFQTFNANTLLTSWAKKANYQLQTTNKNESQYEMLKKLELNEKMHQKLIEHCENCSIKFLSTGFDIKSVKLLLKLGQNCFKIPSGEMTNLPYLRFIGSLRKRVILSSGMSTMKEIKKAIELIEKAGTIRDSITVLHCTSQYPAPMNEVNLSAMNTIKDMLEVSVGYSDHTLGIEVPTAAVALGASIIEKHFTLDRNLQGPDHKASLEPSELKAMVHAIRNIERAIGDGIKKPTLSEKQNISLARKSLVAKKAIRCGEIFSNENLTVKRPGNGLSPMLWDEIIGKRAVKDFFIDDLINF